MTDGYIMAEPPRRGSRDPELARAMSRENVVVQVDDDALGDDANPAIELSYPALLEGDVVVAKVTTEIVVGEDRAWVSYGVQSSVQTGESEEDAFMRIGSVVNTRVIDQASDFAERVTELQGPPPPRGQIQRRR